MGEKRFDTVQDLVADGLITFYLEAKAADYIAALSSQSNYAESPYVAYNTRKKQQLAAPKRSGARRANTSNKEGSTGSENTSVSSVTPVSGPSTGSGSLPKADTGSGHRSRGQANLPVEGPRLSQILETRESHRQSQSHDAHRQSQSHEQQSRTPVEQPRSHDSPRASHEVQRRSQSHEQQCNQIHEGQRRSEDERAHRHSGSHESHRHSSHEAHRHSGSHEAHRLSQPPERHDNKAPHHHHHREVPPPEPNANRTSPQGSQRTSPQNTYQNSAVIMQLAQQHQQKLQDAQNQQQSTSTPPVSIPVAIPSIPEDNRLSDRERERVSSSTNTDGPVSLPGDF